MPPDTLITIITHPPLIDTTLCSTSSFLLLPSNMNDESDEVLDHFREILSQVTPRGKTQQRRQCRHCPQSYSLTTGCTNLRDHLHKKHPGVPVPPLLLPPSSSSSLPAVSLPRKRRTTQTTLDDGAIFLDNEGLLPALSAFFGRCTIAHHIIEFPEMLALANAIRSSTCPLPSRYLLRQGIIDFAQSLRSRVVRQLRCYCRSSPLTVAIDGWTNVNTSKVTNVVILCGGVAYYWCSIVNGLNHNTALWLRDPLVKVLKCSPSSLIPFSTFTNGSLNQRAVLWLSPLTIEHQ